MAHTITSERRHTSSIYHRCQWKRHYSLALWHCPTSNDLQSPNDEEDEVMAAQAKVISMRNLNLKTSPEFSRLVLSICFLMNLRFLLRWERTWIQSDICIKKWIYLERNIFHRQTVGHLRRQETLKYGIVSFGGLGNFTNYQVGWLFQLFWGRRQRFPGIEPWLTSWLLMVIFQLSRCYWLCHLAYANVLH